MNKKEVNNYIVKFFVTFVQNYKKMKKILSTIALVFVLGTFAFAQNNGESRAVAKARVAAHDCLVGQSNVSYYVTENFNCNIFDGIGINRTVTFISNIKCPKGAYCILGFIPLATVVVDCNYNVTSTSCDGLVTQ